MSLQFRIADQVLQVDDSREALKRWSISMTPS